MREYNSKISARANESLMKREQAVRMQKKMLAIACISIAFIVIILCSSISAFAKSQQPDAPLYKYYTSIRVEKGDTLWDLADEYIGEKNMDKKAYIDEVCRMNHLENADMIKSGQYIGVYYYSPEMK